MSNLGFEFDHRWQDFDTRPDGSIADPGWLATAEVRDAQLEDYLSVQASATTTALAALDTRVDTLEATDIAYDTRLDNLEAADIALDGRLDTIEASYARGQMGKGTASAAQGSIGTSPTDLTSLTVTFTAVAGRRYKIEGLVKFRKLTSNGIVYIEIVRGSTVLNTSFESYGVGDYGTLRVDFDEVPGAGSTTYKLRGFTSGDTFDVNPTTGASVAVSSIRVLDVGV